MNNEEVTAKCKKCGSDNLSLTLETPNGYRYKCNDCEDTFVSETKLTGENIKDLTTKIDMEESDERKTIKISKKSYIKLETIRQDMDFTTIIDTVTYVLDNYKTQKDFMMAIFTKEKDFDDAIIQTINTFGRDTVGLMEKFWNDIHNEISELKEQPKPKEDKVIKF